MSPRPAPVVDSAITPEESSLNTLLRLLGLVLLAAAIAAPLFCPCFSLFADLDSWTVGAVATLFGLLGIASFMASANVRLQTGLVTLVALGHALAGLHFLFGAFFSSYGNLWLILGAVMLLMSIAVSLQSGRASKAGLRLSYFSATEYRSLVSLADALNLDEEAAVPPEDVARNVDRYLAGFTARGKWLVKVALRGLELYPLLSLKPPLSLLEVAERRKFLESRFYQDVAVRLLPEGWRRLVQAMIRIGKQMSYLGYYADPRSFVEVGYVRFSERPDAEARLAAAPGVPRRPLDVIRPAHVDVEEISADVVIVGSGAGGSILAHGLLEQGRDVLMIERGDYEDPETFTEDEVEMLGRLYSDGALQLSRDFRFQILQGSCLGGTTVVNNAVSFEIPGDVLARWNDTQGYAAGISPGQLKNAYQYVSNLVRVTPQEKNLNPGASAYMAGMAALGLDRPPNGAGVISANIENCAGCGYCNIGCRFGRKLSMLDLVLPEAQGKYGSDRFRIMVGADVQHLTGTGRRVDGLECTLTNGRRVRVRANTVAVCAGAVSSSLLLTRSGIGGRKAGQGLSFNMGSPVTAVFDHPVHSFDGLQISHFLDVHPRSGFVHETWFNPPVSQALTMPGWFGDHRKNMLRYDRLTSVGVLVGTEGNAVIRPAGLTGRDIRFTPTPQDWKTLLDGLLLAGDILYAGGAKIVMPHTFEYMEFESKDAWHRFPTRLRDPSDMTLGTGHPQGGNRLSAQRSKGVLDPEFRVWDYDNLFVCDASVFPTSIGVNPQLTVMALARYAVPFVAASR